MCIDASGGYRVQWAVIFKRKHQGYVHTIAYAVRGCIQ